MTTSFNLVASPLVIPLVLEYSPLFLYSPITLFCLEDCNCFCIAEFLIKLHLQLYALPVSAYLYIFEYSKACSMILAQKFKECCIEVELIVVCLESFSVCFKVIEGPNLTVLPLCNKLSAFLYTALLFRGFCN